MLISLCTFIFMLMKPFSDKSSNFFSRKLKDYFFFTYTYSEPRKMRIPERKYIGNLLCVMSRH